MNPVRTVENRPDWEVCRVSIWVTKDPQTSDEPYSAFSGLSLTKSKRLLMSSFHLSTNDSSNSHTSFAHFAHGSSCFCFASSASHSTFLTGSSSSLLSAGSGSYVTEALPPASASFGSPPFPSLPIWLCTDSTCMMHLVDQDSRSWSVSSHQRPEQLVHHGRTP